MKNPKLITILFLTVFACFGGRSAKAQSLLDEMIVNGETVSASADSTVIPVTAPATAHPFGLKAAEEVPSLWKLTDAYGNPLDSLQFGPQVLTIDPEMDVRDIMLPKIVYLPPIYGEYTTQIPDTTYARLIATAPSLETMGWADRVTERDRRGRIFMQNFMMAYPQFVLYNLASMPRAPKDFVMEVDPTTAKISVTEFSRDVKQMKSVAPTLQIERIHWLQNFDASMQFSQAYVSPNWYQGGKSNINGILTLNYNINLNQAFHPNLIFENYFQYRLGANNAPDDKVHSYNITEDLFQINSKFGLKAIRKWYYSVNSQFKTQLLNSYNPNSNDLRSAAFAPADLNVGVGMTYATNNKKNTVTFNAALSPLSYNLKMCFNPDIPVTRFGIEEGKKTISQYGSSAEFNFRAKIAYNIEYFSRVFGFTNYEIGYGDWENTLTFTINRFLTTKIFAHVRYQSDAKPNTDYPNWHRWQLKEILSIGFSYRFSRS